MQPFIAELHNVIAVVVMQFLHHRIEFYMSGPPDRSLRNVFLNGLFCLPDCANGSSTCASTQQTSYMHIASIACIHAIILAYGHIKLA